MMYSSQMVSFIDALKARPEFIKLNYFLRSMKKMPHGGVINIPIPNCFIMHYSPFNALRMYFPRLGGEIQHRFVFTEPICAVKALMELFSISLTDLLQYICDQKGNDACWYLSCCLAIQDNQKYHDHMDEIFSVIDHKSIDGTSFTIKSEELSILFLCVLSELTQITNINMITENEILQPDSDKYGLSNISNAIFQANGFIIENKFYPYNIFFDISIGAPMARTPLIIDLMKRIDDISIWMRRDNAIALDAAMAYSVATLDAQRFRGTTFDIKKMDLHKKNIIVHYDPETMNKLYLSISQMESEKTNVLSLVVEELWSPDLVDDDIITTNFIHATYNMETDIIEHMDHSINQYNKDMYQSKYMDAKNETNIPIDAYADDHYKIWCIKSPKMHFNDWCTITNASLAFPFRSLFQEMLSR